MTSLESLVPSLAVCQQLETAGFPQDTALVWVNVPQGFINGGGWGIYATGKVQEIPFTPEGGYTNEVMPRNTVNTLHTVLCGAPVAEEISKELPWSIQPWLPNITCMFLLSSKESDGFVVSWRTSDNRQGVPCDDDNYNQKESESAAHAYLWWKKEITK